MESSTSSSCTGPANGECPVLLAMNLESVPDSDLAGGIEEISTSDGPELLLEMLEMRWWREDELITPD